MAFFDPAAADFASPAAVDKELRRVADICHTCRRCYNLCTGRTPKHPIQMLAEAYGLEVELDEANA